MTEIMVVGPLPMSCLGLPLGSSFRAKTLWNDIIDIIERRLSSWKKLYLFEGWRFVLIKSTLSSLAVCFLSLFKMPIHVANRLEKLLRDFLIFM